MLFHRQQNWGWLPHVSWYLSARLPIVYVGACSRALSHLLSTLLRRMTAGWCFKLFDDKTGCAKNHANFKEEEDDLHKSYIHTHYLLFMKLNWNRYIIKIVARSKYVVCRSFFHNKEINSSFLKDALFVGKYTIVKDYSKHKLRRYETPCYVDEL